MTKPILVSRPLVFLFALIALLVPLAEGQTTPEIRGMWVDTWGAGFRTAAEIDALVAAAQRGNFNTILPQVRRRGDAFYNSTLEPKNTAVAANFDPLTHLIQRAHAASPPIEVHAWIVVYPIWANRDTPPSNPNHIYNKHPDWLTQNSSGVKWDGSDVNGNYYVDPGHPGVQQHTFDVAMDIISRYNVDGFHLDYIRYSSRNFGYNPVAVQRFNTLHGRTGQPATTDATWSQFRRDQVTQLVRKIYLESIALKPNVKISAATIGFAPGITTTSQWPNSAAYSDKMQDWRAWMEEGIVDINMPMFYFDQTQWADAWTRWNTFGKNHKYNRHLAVGLGWWINTVGDTLQQTRDTRLPTAAGHRAEGIVGFQYRATNNQGVGRNAFLDAHTSPSIHDPAGLPVFPQKVSPPAMPWKINPTRGHLKGFVKTQDGTIFDSVTVTLTGPQNRTIRTDGTGFYGFVDLLPGAYSVTVDLPGWEASSQSISIAAGQVGHRDLVLAPELLAEIIIDHPAATLTGTWSTGSFGTPYSANYRWTSTVTGAPTHTALYRPTIGIPGTYNIDVWFTPGTNRTPDARHEIAHSGGTSTVSISQVTGGNRWERLASGIHFDAGNSGFVRILNQANRAGDALIAGAVRFSLVEADPDPVLFFSELAVHPGGLTAHVIFSTQRPATVSVEYGLTQATASSTPASSTAADFHTVKLTGLTPGETYQARLHATEGTRTYASNWFTFQTVPAIIVDATMAQTTFSGSWTVSTDTTGWNTYRFANRVAGSATATATFRPNLPVAGTYNVATYYREGTNRSTATPYLVSWNGGSETVAVNQQINGRNWFTISTNRPFQTGTGGFVRIANGPAANGNVVIADAVRFTLVEAEIRHPLTVVTEGSGTVSRDPNSPTYPHGQTVQLTATPATGWVFSGWDGDASGGAAQSTVTMNGPREVIATFRQVFDLSVSVMGEGTVTIDPQKTGYLDGDLVQISAAPAEGWEFAGWSGDAPGMENPLSLLIDSNKTVIAHFTRPSAYAAWTREHFTEEEQEDASVSGPQADPDGRGIPNLARFAFGLDPRDPDPADLPAAGFENGRLTLSFSRLRESGEIDYLIEVSPDLVTWQPAEQLIEEARVDPVDDRLERVTWQTTEPANGGRQFLRVRLVRR